MYHGSNTPFPTQACAVAAAPAPTLDSELDALALVIQHLEANADGLCDALGAVSQGRPPAAPEPVSNELPPPLPPALERVRYARQQLERINLMLVGQQNRLALA